MIQGVLIIRRQIDAIRHSARHASISTEEWRSLEKIARSTIRIHLAENVYWQRRHQHSLCGWNYMPFTRKASSSSKLILIWQLFNMKMRKTDPVTSHINTFNRVLSELSSQGINFEEEVKALAVLLSLLTSWEVFYTTFANSCLKLNFDKTIGQVLTEDIRRKSMGITIDDSTKAHNLNESIYQFNRSRKQAERTGQNSSRPRH